MRPIRKRLGKGHLHAYTPYAKGTWTGAKPGIATPV